MDPERQDYADNDLPPPTRLVDVLAFLGWLAVLIGPLALLILLGVTPGLRFG